MSDVNNGGAGSAGQCNTEDDLYCEDPLDPSTSICAT